jgi:DinB superfamily
VSRVGLLLAMMDSAYGRLRSRLDGLTDDEFCWRPVPDCWTVYRKESGRWRYSYAVPEPDPAPVTTIGWQVVHVALCKVMYHEWAYGPGRLTWPELDVPHTAAGAIALLERGQGLLGADLDGPVGRRARRAAADELGRPAGGRVGCLRDLYCWTGPA